MDPPKPGDVSCSPTLAQPSADGARIWVACNKASDIVEIDARLWKVVRRIPAGPGVYNLALTGDGTRLIATNKRGQSVLGIRYRDEARVGESPDNTPGGARGCGVG